MKSSKSNFKLSPKDLELLKNHVRLVNGLEVPQKKVKKIMVKDPQPKLNSAHTFRMECIKKRRKFIDNVIFEERKERVKLKSLSKRHTERRKSIQFSLNKAFHMRWKKVRRLPVLTSHDREVFNDTGKLPFSVPVFYKPFHPHLPDWSNQEFIFLDENEEKKNSTSTTLQPTPSSSTPSSSITDKPPVDISTTGLPENMTLTTTVAIK